MNANVISVLFTCLTATLVEAKLGAPGGPQKLPTETIDALKAMASFEYLVTIADSDNDTSLECMYSRRTEFDPENQRITYVWVFPSTGEEIPLHVELGDSPGTVVFTLPGDPTPKQGIFYYTDYKNCVVGDVEYHGHQCSLWTRIEVKDAVPQNCIDHFVDMCGVVVPQHSRDLCKDGEGDY